MQYGKMSAIETVAMVLAYGVGTANYVRLLFVNIIVMTTRSKNPILKLLLEIPGQG